jgi:hypothetical protein
VFREDWLGQLIAELDDTDSYEFVKHLTDVHRLHLFDIVMQYRAIFFDSSAQVCVRVREGSHIGTCLVPIPDTVNAVLAREPLPGHA